MDKKILLENKMFRAASLNHYHKLKELIEEGVDVNALSTIKKKYVLPGQTALMVSADEGHIDCVKLLIAHGADINYAASFTTIHSLAGYEPYQRRTTALIQAASNRTALDCVKYLVENGADINFQDQSGKTALMQAISRSVGNDIILFLLESGSDLMIKDDLGKNVIQIVSQYNNESVLKLITSFQEQQKLKEQLNNEENNGNYFNI